MTQHTGEQVDNRRGSSEARLVKSGPKMLARPLKRSFGSQSAVGGYRTEVVGLQIRRRGVILVLQKGGGQVGHRQTGNVGLNEVKEEYPSIEMAEIR